jgi:hypothetical protein
VGASDPWSLKLASDGIFRFGRTGLRAIVPFRGPFCFVRSFLRTLGITLFDLIDMTLVRCVQLLRVLSPFDELSMNGRPDSGR